MSIDDQGCEQQLSGGKIPGGALNIHKRFLVSFFLKCADMKVFPKQCFLCGSPVFHPYFYIKCFAKIYAMWKQCM